MTYPEFLNRLIADRTESFRINTSARTAELDGIKKAIEDCSNQLPDVLKMILDEANEQRTKAHTNNSVEPFQE